MSKKENGCAVCCFAYHNYDDQRKKIPKWHQTLKISRKSSSAHTNIQTCHVEIFFKLLLAFCAIGYLEIQEVGIKKHYFAQISKDYGKRVGSSSIQCIFFLLSSILRLLAELHRLSGEQGGNTTKTRIWKQQHPIPKTNSMGIISCSFADGSRSHLHPRTPLWNRRILQRRRRGEMIATINYIS